jgi:hypothetical protein
VQERWRTRHNLSIPPDSDVPLFFQRAVRYTDLFVPREAGPALSILQCSEVGIFPKAPRTLPLSAFEMF